MLTSLSDTTVDNDGSNEIAELSFYPEGGDLIDGVSSQVAFVAIDSLGQPVSLEGFIKDHNDNIVTACT